MIYQLYSKFGGSSQSEYNRSIFSRLFDAVNYNNNKENHVLKTRLAKYKDTKDNRQLAEDDVIKTLEEDTRL